MEFFLYPSSVHGAFEYVPLIIYSKIWHTSTLHDVHYDGSKAQSCIVQNFAPRAVKVRCPYQAQPKKTFLSTSNVIISQSMRSTFLKLFLHILLII
jgi:hypothetical protein